MIVLVMLTNTSKAKTSFPYAINYGKRPIELRFENRQLDVLQDYKRALGLEGNHTKIIDKDIAGKSQYLGYESKKVETLKFTDTLNFEPGISGYLLVSILVDDYASLEVENNSVTNKKTKLIVNGAALWRKNSFKTFTNKLIRITGEKQQIKLNLLYKNTANLTGQYKKIKKKQGYSKEELDGVKDVDGVSIYIVFITHPPLTINAAVDFNRDGLIKFDGLDKTNETNPYRFWINNDQDRKEKEAPSVEGDQNPILAELNDSEDLGVNSRRDLEDFTRIRIDLSSIFNEIKKETKIRMVEVPIQRFVKTKTEAVGNYRLHMKFEPISNKPSLSIIRACEDNGDIQYLTNEKVGLKQYQLGLGPNVDVVDENLAFCYKTEKTTDTIRDEKWLNVSKILLDSVSRKGFSHLLFEGKRKGKGKLIFRLSTVDQKTPAVEEAIYIDLNDVREMYETYTVGDPVRQGVHWDIWPANKTKQITGTKLKPLPKNQNQDYVMLVHGWDMAKWEKDYFASTMYKRLWHQGYKGRFGSYNWPTFHGKTRNPVAGARIHFDASEHRAWHSAEQLADLLSVLSKKYKNSKGESLVRCYAHSLGNLVTSEALRIMNTKYKTGIHTYVSAQSAISSRFWDPKTPREINTLVPDIHSNYWTKGQVQNPKMWKGNPSYFDAKYMPKNMTYINHYNERDNALVWFKRNQWLKPDLNYNYFHDINRFIKTNDPKPPTILAIPADKYEIFSYIAVSHGHATGAVGATKGLFTEKLDVDAVFKFGNTKWGHSAQFRYTIHERWAYWKETLIQMKL